MDSNLWDKAVTWIQRRKRVNRQKLLQLSVNLAKEDFQRALNFSQANDVEALPEIRCEVCSGRGIRSDVLHTMHGDWVMEVLGNRPSANESLDQAPVSLEQMYLDIAFILDRLSNEESFLFLGDDDFHSVVLARYAPWLNIQVLDADPRIVAALNDLAELYALPVKAEIYDAQHELPQTLMGCFDAFYCDPPYSPLGIHLFADRGILALRQELGTWGLIAVPMTLLPKDVRVMLRNFQEYLVSNGFVTLDVIPAHKLSSHSKGIVSGLIRFERVCIMSSSIPDLSQDTLYSHFF